MDFITVSSRQHEAAVVTDHPYYDKAKELYSRIKEELKKKQLFFNMGGRAKPSSLLPTDFTIVNDTMEIYVKEEEDKEAERLMSEVSKIIPNELSMTQLYENNTKYFVLSVKLFLSPYHEQKQKELKMQKVKGVFLIFVSAPLLFFLLHILFFVGRTESQ